VKSHGNNVHDIIIVHMKSGDAQTKRREECKAILGPAGCVLSMQPAGKMLLILYKLRLDYIRRLHSLHTA